MSFRARDSQKSKVYRWEEQFGSKSPSLSKDACIALMTKARARYGLKPVKIVFDPRQLRCSTAYGDHKIRLAVWGTNVITVLHETAHTIINSNSKAFYYTDEELADKRRRGRVVYYKSQGFWDVASHGPEFCAVLVDLFQEFGVAKQADAMAEARKRGIKVASPLQMRRKLYPERYAGVAVAVAASPATPPAPVVPVAAPVTNPPLFGHIQLGLF